MTGVVDYGAGNIHSVVAALTLLGRRIRVITGPSEFSGIQSLIVPGVGEARAAMNEVAARDLTQALIDFAASGKPFLGICLGSQILLDHSEERDTPCLGIVAGSCRSFLGEFERRSISPYAFKIPHIGWNQVYDIPADGLGAALFDGISDGRSFYFDHGFYNEPADESLTWGWTDHGIGFASVYGRERIAAVQFHPEKSGAYGLKLLDNFLKHF